MEERAGGGDAKVGEREAEEQKWRLCRRWKGGMEFSVDAAGVGGEDLSYI
jgi:hypothetical protein